MSMEMSARVSAYGELWTRLNAVNGLIQDLEAERAEIKTRQRSLANGMVSRYVEQMKADTTAEHESHTDRDPMCRACEAER